MLCLASFHEGMSYALLKIPDCGRLSVVLKVLGCPEGLINVLNCISVTLVHGNLLYSESMLLIKGKSKRQHFDRID